MTSVREASAALALLLLLSGCGTSDALPPGGSVRDSAGVRLIDLPPSGQGRTRALVTDSSWTPASGVEIGRLTDVAVSPDGRVLLLDGMGAEIHVLAAAGDVVTSFGRPGEGPGEFSPGGLLRNLLATDSSVLVPDLHLQRVTEFSFAGEVMRIIPFPLQPLYAVDWRTHPDGGVAFRALDPAGDLLLRLVEGRVDTLFAFSNPIDNPNLLLSPSGLWDVRAGGRLVTARTDEPVVALREGGAGGVIWLARRSDLGGEMGGEDRGHLQNLVAESIRRNGADPSPEQLAGLLASIEYPDRVPVLAAVFTTEGGEVWVRHARPVGEMDLEALRIGSADGYGGREWEVLGPEGLSRSRVTLPVGFTPRRFVGEWIYGVLADDLGIERAARVKRGG